ncbi:RNA polymerase subunit sigma [Thalassotalea sp. PP2-459]|nr:RNA polymerase subunit sigma [Thalassotalea sp. PP2-459]
MSLNNKNQNAAIAKLADEHGRLVFHTAYRLLGNSHSAEDVTQEVFIKLFKKPTNAFDSIKNWPAYLRTMASSAAIDQLRRRQRLAEESMDYSTNDEVPLLDKTQHNADPYREIALSRDIEHFSSALAELTAQDAHVFCLRHIEEFSYQEIAEQLGISNSLVGVTLHRAQQKLSQLVGESQFLGAGYEITG